MTEDNLIAWKIHTAKSRSDMEDVIKYVNIDFIDYDHKVLTEYAVSLNKLLEKSKKDFSISIINETKELLEGIIDYATAHFQREETFMEEYNLPGIDLHKLEHKRLLEILGHSLQDFKTGKIKLTSSLKTQVTDWLVQHINVTDYEFFEIVNWKDNFLMASNWEDVKPVIRLTGIKDIDLQHKDMTELAIRAVGEMERNSDKEVVTSLCSKLIECASAHFDYEADFMKKYEIDEIESHYQEHEYFIAIIKAYENEILSEKDIIGEMKMWLLDWWIKHINTVDCKYFAYKNWAYKLLDKEEKLENVLVTLRLTGIEDFDSDHMVLMELTFKLNVLIKNLAHAGSNEDRLQDIREQVLALMQQIYTYAKKHFEREEKFMLENNVREYHEHSEEHQEILERIEELEINYRNQRLCLSSNLKTMILDWWINHTNNTDYRTFVKH